MACHNVNCAGVRTALEHVTGVAAESQDHVNCDQSDVIGLHIQEQAQVSQRFDLVCHQENVSILVMFKKELELKPAKECLEFMLLVAVIQHSCTFQLGKGTVSSPIKADKSSTVS